MLTKKDFKAVAEIINAAREDDFIGENFKSSCEDFDLGWDRACRGIVPRLADYFTTDNPRFDRSRFMRACGLTE